MTSTVAHQPKPRFTYPEMLDALEAAPVRLVAATNGIPADVLHAPMEAGGWSARDILGHIRACNGTWGGYIDRILDEDQPAYRAESPRSTIDQTDFLEQPFGASLEAFVHDRARPSPDSARLERGRLARIAMVKLAGRGEQPEDGVLLRRSDGRPRARARRAHRGAMAARR